MTPSMNAHNEQQPAAAQETVMLYYVANVEQGGDFNYIPISMFDLPAIFTTLAKAEAFCEFANGAGSKHEVRRFAAPVTAAPADTWFADQLTAMGEVIPLDSTPAAQPVTDPVAAYERELAAGATHEHALHAICTPAAPMFDYQDVFGSAAAAEAVRDAGELLRTPAAPGIDLGQLRELAREIRITANDWVRRDVTGNAVIRSFADRIEALIDASPKGATLNEQFGSAEGLDSAVGMEAHYRQVLERIATQGPHYGPDGTRETWKHWSDIARDALADSPKSGSDEAAWSAGYRAAMNAAASGVQELYRNHVHHTGSDGLIARAMELEQSFIRDAAMQAQASDAEVRP